VVEVGVVVAVVVAVVLPVLVGVVHTHRRLKLPAPATLHPLPKHSA
jgi:ABC-type nitrate/sulfonate/bicarbonate transport system permease component